MSHLCIVNVSEVIIKQYSFKKRIMALVRNEFGIKGRVGNVVFCKLNGKSYMRRESVSGDFLSI